MSAADLLTSFYISMKKISALLLLVLAFFPSASYAQISISSTTGNVYDIPGSVEDQASGSMMGSFQLTARWLDGQSRVMSYGLLGGSTWGFTSDRLSLTIDGSSDTFSSYWSGSNSIAGLYQLEFDAKNTNVLFDRTFYYNFAEGTPGSNLGWDGDIACDGLLYLLCELGTSVVYTDAARIAPNEPVGDLYRKMTMTFSGTGIARGVDGDIIRFDTDITMATVPEPSTYLLMSAGLAGLGIVARRRRGKI